jgi:small-conductance mechanosensitive channel
MDGDNSIEGRVIDITLFSVIISLPNQNKIYYPNNLAVQKPIITTKYE